MTLWAFVNFLLDRYVTVHKEDSVPYPAKVALSVPYLFCMVAA